MTDIQQLERELAYSAARSDIECHCAPEKPPGKYHSGKQGMWWDLGSIDDPYDRAWVARGVAYLEARKLLKRHTDNPALVQVLEDVK